MQNNRIYSLIPLLFFVFISRALLSQITLPAIIGDNMVLQQKQQVPVWGWSAPNKMITVIPGWNNRKVSCITDANGKWIVMIQTPEAGGPYTIKINDTVLTDIMIGEVWFCSGQSNMEWPLRKAGDGEKEIASADFPLIRFFTVARQFSEEPKQNCYGQWLTCSPSASEDFSAVAYFFGKELHNELKVPVGLINASWGGTPAEAWTRNEILRSDTDLQVYLQRFREKITRTKPGVCPFDQYAPSALYNGMIAPVIPFRIKGVIWYQGESNVHEPALYELLFPAMIRNWREDWGIGDFPFYYVQIAPFDYNIPVCGAALRDAQRKTLSASNTGMAVTLDIGDPDDIHPADKQSVGKRLTLLALTNLYGKNNLVSSGPLYSSMNIENDRIRVDFLNASNGLTAKDGILKNFEIAGKDMIFVPAEAVIEGSSVLVSSDYIKSPLAVRYAFRNTDEASLFNRDGLPASSFRTDSWPLPVEQTEIKGYLDAEREDYIITMNCLFNPMEIRYTLDGNEPNRHSELYKEPFHIKKSAMLRACAFDGETASTYVSTLDIYYHLAFGRKPDLKNPYSDKYKAAGPGALTDGIRGSRNFRDERWQGYYFNDLEGIIDLGKEKKISKVTAGFLQSANDWIFFPRTVEVLISSNGQDFTSIGMLVPGESVISRKVERKDYSVEIKGVKTRYIMFKAVSEKVCPMGHPQEGEKAWLFTDEIIVE